MGNMYLRCYLLLRQNSGYRNCFPLMLVWNASPNGNKTPDQEF